MNIKEYISSGIVESYVMGIATEAERAEFEAMCASYPEIAEARNAFEIALENQLLNDAIKPPQFIKKQIEEKISLDDNVRRERNEMNGVAPVRYLNLWKWAAVAAVILFAITGYLAVEANNKYKDLQAVNQNLQDQLHHSTEELNAVKQDEAMLHKPDVKMAAMYGTNSAAYATIYWDTTSKDVYLMVNNLPQPASDKQYQLWALLDGKPIDLGVLARQERLLVKMKNVRDAQAFAITLEPMGGSTLPTSKPVVLSKL